MAFIRSYAAVEAIGRLGRDAQIRTTSSGKQFTETAAGSLRIHSDGGMRHSSIPESAPAQGTLISQPCAKVLP